MLGIVVIGIGQETLLRQFVFRIRDLFDRDHRQTHLVAIVKWVRPINLMQTSSTYLHCPGQHDSCHIIVQSQFIDLREEVIGYGVLIFVFIQIVGYGRAERRLAQKVFQHANQRGALGIRDRVEDFGYLIGILNCLYNGMRSQSAIQSEDAMQSANDKLFAL